MAESTLVNRYKQYKAGTTKLVNWLTNTARSCQDVTTILPPLRAAKDAAKRSKRNHKPETPLSTNVTVTTSQLLKLAKIVVYSSITIPEDIVQTIKTVIAGRQVCSDLYLSLKDPTDDTADEQNSRHQHFIDVLKQIQKLFESSRNTTKAPKTSKEPQRDTSNTPYGTQKALANIFACLQLDEPTKSPLGSAPSPKHADKHVTFELEDSEYEKSFAIWCLLQDIRDLRREVQNVWQDYKSGKISFSTAAMVSDIAVHMTRFAEAELTEQYPDLQSYAHILQYMGLGILEVGRDVCLVSKNQNKSVKMGQKNLKDDEIAELFTPRAFALMMAFSDSAWEKLRERTENVQAGRKYFFGYHRFGSILESLLPDLDLHRRHKIEIPMLDGFATALCGFMAHPGSVPTITLVTVCQINMDIIEVVGGDFNAGLSEYQDRLEADQSSIYTFLRNWELKNCCTCKTSLVGNALRVKKLLADLGKDPYNEARKDSSISHTTKETSSPPFGLYKALPLIPGMLINISAMQTHSVGIMLCNWGNIVLSTAYLYRAALRSGGLTKPWPDMEFVIETHSKNRPLILEPDTETANMAKCFGVALGVKGSAYRRGQRPRLPKTSFIQQYGRKLSTEWPLEKAMEEWDWNGNVSDRGSPFVKAAVKSLESLKKQEQKDHQLRNLCDQYEKIGKVTPSQLLLCFKAVFIEHEMDMKFDYISFFFSCATLLNTIERDLSCCLRTLEIDSGSDFTNAHELVYAILWDAAEGYERPEHHPHCIVFDAGKILEHCIVEKEGAKYSDLARSQTSGYTTAPQLSCEEKAENQATALTDGVGSLIQLLGLPSGSMSEVDGADVFCGSEEDFNDRTAILQDFIHILESASAKPEGEVKLALADAARERFEGMPIELVKKLRWRVSQMKAARESISTNTTS